MSSQLNGLDYSVALGLELHYHTTAGILINCSIVEALRPYQIATYPAVP